MFGFSASFNDSIVYFTTIQEVDSVWFTQKKNMLAGRSNYSNQLREYCNDKLQNKKATYDVRFISEEDFKFVTINLGEGKDEVAPKMPQKKPKAPKDKKKKDGKTPPPPKK